MTSKKTPTKKERIALMASVQARLDSHVQKILSDTSIKFGAPKESGSPWLSKRKVAAG